MKNTLLFAFGVLALSCSHDRVTDKPKVQFAYAPELVEAIQKAGLGRGPSSAPLEAREEKSPRRVYFSSLYHQSLVLGHYLKKDSRREFCPQFHHDKIEAEGHYVPQIVTYKKSQVDEEGREYFPELAFHKNFSLRDYHQELQVELDELCEEGISDNYYKFDNLITHYADKSSFHSHPKAMESVLKIPVFANLYLISMLRGDQQVTSHSPEEGLLISLTQTHWFDRYLSQAAKLRHTFIKNKVVDAK